MDITTDEIQTTPHPLPSPVKVHPPCTVCGNRVESISEDPETGLLRRTPCGCAD
jgi:hypothetical protein